MDKNNFPSAGGKRRSRNYGFLFSFIIFLIIPAYEGISLSDYDLVIGNGNRVMLLHSSANSSLNLPIVPRGRDEQFPKILAVVPDLKNDHLYYSLLNKTASSVEIYNFRDNSTVQIYTGPRWSVGGMTFYKDYLYWYNELDKTVVRLPVPTEVQNRTKSKVPDLVFEDQNATFDSLAIHPLNGNIFYTKWRTGSQSEILMYDQSTKTSTVFIDNVYQPRSLSTSSSHLYWSDNPPGIYYSVERASLSSPSERELIERGQHQNPFAISVPNCSRKMFWTDVLNKVLWEYDLKEKSLKLLHYYEDTVPYGITLTKEDEICKEEYVNDNQSQSNKSSSSTNSSDTTTPDEDSKINAYRCNSSENKHCENGASCLKLDDQIRCLCHPDFGGSTCSEMIKMTIIKEESDSKDKSQNTNVPQNIRTSKEGDDAYSSTSAPTNSQSAASVLSYIYTTAPEDAKINAHSCNSSDHKYCENGSSCLKLDDKIHCLCQVGFGGPTCSEMIKAVPLARNSDSNLDLFSWSSNPPFFLSCIVFIIVVSVLLVVITFLACKVRRLGQKPRIRRRLVVSHRPDVDTNSTGANVCEMIDIENCCNMNVCETPCYERVTGSGSNVVISEGGKRIRNSPVKEDKVCLLSSK